jgi:VanZ family protein
MAFITYMSSRSGLPDINQWFPNMDKIAHFGVYLILGISVQLAILGYFTEAGRRTLMISTVLFGLAFGITDEFHQSFVPGRDCSFGDLIADIIGVALSLIFIKYVILIFEKMKKKYE